MKEKYYANYRDQLREGMRVEIGIPLSGGGIFRDWAIISKSHGDELMAQISRDVLPTNVRVDVGFILDVSIWIRQEVYTCSGIVTEKLGGRVLKIRLFGDFTLRERRQFFRIDLELRLKYAGIDHANRGDIQRDWEQRRDLEHMKFQGYDDFVIAAQTARFDPTVKLEWKQVLWGMVNLGGGGIMVGLPDAVSPDHLLALEILLPLTPPRQIQAVAQVIHVLSPKVEKGNVCFRTGMQFVFLDERDRDLLFRHISVTQIGLLRRVADVRELAEPEQPVKGEEVPWRQVVRRALWALLFLVITGYLVRYLIHYQREAPPNEIQRSYEKAIREYRHETK